MLWTCRLVTNSRKYEKKTYQSWKGYKATFKAKGQASASYYVQMEKTWYVLSFKEDS